MSIPTLPVTCSPSEFAEAYAKAHAVLLRGSSRREAKNHFDLEKLRSLVPEHDELRREALASFTVENAPIDTDGGKKRKRMAASAASGPKTADDLFGGSMAPTGLWYASCIMQRQPEALLAAVPLVAPHCLDDASARHSKAVWLFIGRNDSSAPLAGRPEHTDNVQHSGTWHYQAEGCKEWRLRPSDELRAACPAVGGMAACTVRCEQGDVLVVSTRDWWHATTLPPQPPPSHVSISYAREFNFASTASARAAAAFNAAGGGGASSEVASASVAATSAASAEPSPPQDGGDDDDDDEELTMGNTEGLAAATAIKAGGLVLREAEMPSVHLPCGAAFNVEVRVDAESGERKLVATRDLRSGEALVLPPDGVGPQPAGEEEGEEEGEEGEGEEDEEDEDEGEEEEDDEPVVQCDRRDCRREIADPSEIIFMSSLGQDFCSTCTAKFPPDRQAGMRRMTVAERLAEVLEEG